MLELCAYCKLTVPHRLGTMKSLGSLSVNAMRLVCMLVSKVKAWPLRAMGNLLKRGL